MIYFITDSRRSPRHNHKICRDGHEIGVVTSGSFSPSLSRGIGIGYVKPGHAEEGSVITLTDGNTRINAAITERPFYKKGTARG